VAARQKGSRRIVVDGVTFVWRFPRRPTQSQDDGWPGVAVTANREGCPRATLFLAFPRRFHPSGPGGGEPPRPVLPSDVASGIRSALAAGWVADRPGKQFEVWVAERDAELGPGRE